MVQPTTQIRRDLTQESDLSGPDLLGLLVPTLPSSLFRADHLSDQRLESLERAAIQAVGSRDFRGITASNPALGTLLENLSNAGLSEGAQKSILSLVFKAAETVSGEPYSPESMVMHSNHEIMSGLTNSGMTGSDALKTAAAIAAAIVEQSAQNAREEAQRMAEIQSRIGAIPAAVKATVLAEYNVASMTNGEIITAIERELADQKIDKNGDHNILTTS
jgi:hypothetical protein